MEKRKSLVAQCVGTVRQLFGSLWLAAAWPHVCMALLWICVGVYLRTHHSPGEQPDPLNIWPSMDGLQKFGVIAAFVVATSLPQGLAIGGVSAIVWKYLQTGTTSLRDAYSAVSSNFVQLPVLSVCVGTVTILGSMLLLIPGLAAFIFTALAVPIMVIERVGILTAIRRSAKLATTNLGAVLFSAFAAIAIVIVLLVPLLVVLFMLVAPNVPWLVNLIAMWTVLVLVASISQMVVATMLTHIYANSGRANAELTAIRS